MDIDTEVVWPCLCWIRSAKTLSQLEESGGAIGAEQLDGDNRLYVRMYYAARKRDIQEADDATRTTRLNVDAGGETADRGNREDNQPDSV